MNEISIEIINENTLKEETSPRNKIVDLLILSKKNMASETIQQCKKDSHRKQFITFYNNCKIHFYNCGIRKQLLFFIKNNKKEISNKFLSITLHILIMIVFEVYFYFNFAVVIEKQKFLDKINSVFMELNELQMTLIEYQAFKMVLLDKTNIITDGLYNNYKNTLEIQHDLLFRLLIKSIKMASIVGIIMIVFLINGVCHKNLIKWKWIMIENILMFAFLGIFEYFFFINIILKYDPITDDEIKYVMTTGFIDYLNKTVIIT